MLGVWCGESVCGVCRLVSAKAAEGGGLEHGLCKLEGDGHRSVCFRGTWDSLGWRGRGNIVLVRSRCCNKLLLYFKTAQIYDFTIDLEAKSWKWVSLG